MINFKKVAALALASVMSISLLAGCGAKGGSDDASGNPHHKIGVGYYTDNGAALVAIKAYLEGIKDDLNCEFEVFTISTYDENANLTKVQEMISAGYEGIIMSADMGSGSILAECEKAGVYVAGYLCDYNESFYTNYDAVFGSEYFLGTINDGEFDKTAYVEEISNDIISNGYKKVGLITFPSWAYPLQAEIARMMMEKFDAAGIEYVDPIELSFTTLSDGAPTYLDDNKDIDCVFSICAGANFVYPDLVAAGRTDLPLYTAGFEGKADMENFRGRGNGMFRSICCTPTEGIAYAIVLMVDKLNGAKFDDAPATPERLPITQYVILSDEEMDAMSQTIYCTGNYEDSVLKGDAVKNLCKSFNDQATYADLCAAMESLHGNL